MLLPKVSGMTCGCCVAAVIRAVKAVPSIATMPHLDRDAAELTQVGGRQALRGIAMTTALAENTCTPRRGDVSPPTPGEAEGYQVQAPG
jgi:hypothetical protein